MAILILVMGQCGNHYDHRKDYVLAYVIALQLKCLTKTDGMWYVSVIVSSHMKTKAAGHPSCYTGYSVGKGRKVEMINDKGKEGIRNVYVMSMR